MGTAATILMIVQILAGLTGAEMSLYNLIREIKQDGGIDALLKSLLADLRGIATPQALEALQQSHPELHAQATQLLAPPAATPAP